jgi:hypothetical protein
MAWANGGSLEFALSQVSRARPGAPKDCDLEEVPRPGPPAELLCLIRLVGGMMFAESNGAGLVTIIRGIEIFAAAVIILFVSGTLIFYRRLSGRSMLVLAWLAVVVLASRTAEVFVRIHDFSITYIAIQSALFAFSIVFVCFAVYRKSKKDRRERNLVN